MRSGFTPHLRARCSSRFAGFGDARCPFANLPSARSGHWGEGITLDEMQLLVWVKPQRVVEVSFAEWTRDGSLRHAAFIGLRDDKRARDVRAGNRRRLNVVLARAPQRHLSYAFRHLPCSQRSL